MKRYILLIHFLVLVLGTWAQTFTVNAPKKVQNGENFKLMYTVNTQNVSNLRIGNLPEGLEVIAGPYESSQWSYQMEKGHTSQSSSVTYTYIIYAQKNGTYTIPAAHITAGGKQLASSTTVVTVVGNEPTSANSPKMHSDKQEQAETRMERAGTPINGSDLFIKVSASKSRVREQEPILLTYKVYTLVRLIGLEGKMPDLQGFHIQELPMPQQRSLHTETLNGRTYQCVTWSQYVMYPQMSGKLEIPSIEYVGTVVQSRQVDPLESFFNGGSDIVEVKRKIVAPALTIQVDPLPERPAGFSGGVGKFNISGQLTSKEVRANDAVTLRVVVSGTGNLKLLKQPVVNFPKDFDTYDAKVTDKTMLTASGLDGNMVYDFLAVPRNQGTYTIPPVEFTYYDTSVGAYKTVKTDSFELKVDKGDASSNASADFLDEKNQDIRPLKTRNASVRNMSDLFFGSVAYWVLLAVLLAAFIALLVVFRQRAIDNANIVKLRGKKANKVATRRLRVADKLMQRGRQGEFYDEVLRALWGYVGDKLNIPVTELTHDNISEKLSNQQVDDETVDKFIEAIDECEFERYAPGDATGNMSKTFNTAMDAIMKIEDAMKNKKKHFGKARMLLIGLVLVTCGHVQSADAVTKKEADAEYSKGNYVQAAKDYEELLKKGVSAELYYNLGNTYYRLDDITRAVLNYERAAVLDPADEDIRYNLQKASSKTIDKITPQSEMFFFTWYRSAVNLLNVDGWAWVSVVSLFCALVLVLLYLFARQVSWRKVGFFCGSFFLLLFLLANLFAFQQEHLLRRRSGAIVIVPSATLKATPSASSADQSVIHEGTRVEITDDTMRDWKAVRLADGREGWLKISQMERI